MNDVIKSTIQAKPISKNKSGLLQKESKNFRTHFWEHISVTVKAHKQSNELLMSDDFIDAARGNHTFWKGPPTKPTASWVQRSYKLKNK